MHDQQAGDQVVGDQPLEQLVVEPAGLVRDVEQPLETGAVEVDDEAHQLLGTLAGDLAAHRRGVEQRLDALARRPEVGLYRGRRLLAVGLRHAAVTRR